MEADILVRLFVLLGIELDLKRCGEGGSPGCLQSLGVFFEADGVSTWDFRKDSVAL